MAKRTHTTPPSGPSLAPRTAVTLLKEQKEKGIRLLNEGILSEDIIDPWIMHSLHLLEQSLGRDSAGYYSGAFLNWQRHAITDEDEEEEMYASDVRREMPKAINMLTEAIKYLETLAGTAQEPAPRQADGPIEKLKTVIHKFHSVALQMRKRHDGRETLTIKDEYDVQDLLHSLLRMFFDDIRPEVWTPSYAGGSSKVDFLLKQERIVVEIKKSRPTLRAKDIGDQLIVDIERYSKLPDCQCLICFVYDPEHLIDNPTGLRSDLSGKKNGLMVEVLIEPSAK